MRLANCRLINLPLPLAYKAITESQVKCQGEYIGRHYNRIRENLYYNLTKGDDETIPVWYMYCYEFSTHKHKRGLQNRGGVIRRRGRRKRNCRPNSPISDFRPTSFLVRPVNYVARSRKFHGGRGSPVSGLRRRRRTAVVSSLSALSPRM